MSWGEADPVEVRASEPVPYGSGDMYLQPQDYVLARGVLGAGLCPCSVFGCLANLV